MADFCLGSGNWFCSDVYICSKGKRIMDSRQHSDNSIAYFLCPILVTVTILAGDINRDWSLLSNDSQSKKTGKGTKRHSGFYQIADSYE